MDALSFGLAFGVLVLLGLGTGALTGLSPGLHVNNVAAVVLATVVGGAFAIGYLIGRMFL